MLRPDVVNASAPAGDLQPVAVGEGQETGVNTGPHIGGARQLVQSRQVGDGNVLVDAVELEIELAFARQKDRDDLLQ